VDDSGLGTVVDSLKLGDVDDATTHGSGGDEATGGEVLKRLAVDSSSLLLLATEVSTGRLGAPHDTIDVDSHDLLGSFGGAINEGTILPGNTRVGDEDVEATVELGDDIVDGLVHGLGVDDVDLVSLAYGSDACQHRLSSRETTAGGIGRSTQLTLDTIGLLNVLSLNKSLLVAVVPDGDIGASFCQAMGNTKTNSGTSTGDNGCATLEREEGENAIASGDRHVVMGESAVLHVNRHLISQGGSRFVC
jgi:hypothetical protein